MLQKVSKIIRLPIASVEDGHVVGVVEQPVIDPDNGALLGWVVKTGLFGDRRVVAAVDVRAYDKEALIVRGAEALVEPVELVRLHAVLEGGIRILNAAVRSASGALIGRVADITLTQDHRLAQIEVRNGGDVRIIAWKKVIKVDQAGVWVEDESRLPALKPALNAETV